MSDADRSAEPPPPPPRHAAAGAGHVGVGSTARRRGGFRSRARRICSRCRSCGHEASRRGGGPGPRAAQRTRGGPAARVPPPGRRPEGRAAAARGVAVPRRLLLRPVAEARETLPRPTSPPWPPWPPWLRGRVGLDRLRLRLRLHLRLVWGIRGRTPPACGSSGGSSSSSSSSAQIPWTREGAARPRRRRRPRPSRSSGAPVSSRRRRRRRRWVCSEPREGGLRGRAGRLEAHRRARRARVEARGDGLGGVLALPREDGAEGVDRRAFLRQAGRDRVLEDRAASPRTRNERLRRPTATGDRRRRRRRRPARRAAPPRAAPRSAAAVTRARARHLGGDHELLHPPGHAGGDASGRQDDPPMPLLHARLRPSRQSGRRKRETRSWNPQATPRRLPCAMGAVRRSYELRSCVRETREAGSAMPTAAAGLAGTDEW